MNIFDLKELLARSLKIVVLVLLAPVLVGLVQVFVAIARSLQVAHMSVYAWFAWGFIVYTGMHLILWRPVTVFQFSHRLFSVLAVWLFGGQVTSVQGTKASRNKRRRSETHELVSGASAAEGSPLVAFSPYVVPFYSILVSVAGWFVLRFKPYAWVAGLMIWGVGFALAMHWIMSADDLQEQREAWFFETYLLAVMLIAIITLIVAVGALFWALPDIGVLDYLYAAKLRITDMYVFGFKTLFVPN